MDKIFIENLELYAYHGVNPEEKENGQRFFLDITAAADLREAGLSDDLSDTVSYAKIIKTAATVFCAEKNDLIERAAQRVADALLSEYGRLSAVKIAVKKPDAPITATFETVGVTIKRDKK